MANRSALAAPFLAQWRPLSDRYRPSPFDAAVFALVIGGLALVAIAGRETLQPLAVVSRTPLSLDPRHLPDYALRTTLRMLAAMAASVVFTFVYGTLAVKSRRAEMVLVPLLDILQSVPVLGFATFLLVFFLGLFPGQLLGAELASVFLIFTAQAWNMTFSFYQSLKTVPKDLSDAAASLRLGAWRRFWTLEAPFAAPGLIWNAMLSMSGSWFFVVASEAITVGQTTVTLPGIGSYVALAIDQRNLPAVGYAILAMLVVILIYDQLLFRPLVAWSEKFRVELSAGQSPGSTSWLLDFFQRAHLMRTLTAPVGRLTQSFMRLRFGSGVQAPPAVSRAWSSPLADWAWIGLITAAALWAAFTGLAYVAREVTWAEAAAVIGLGALTLLRVMVLIVLASLIWVPVGVWIGLRPVWAARVQPVAQFLAAFPSNLFFPVAVVVILRFHLNVDVWLSPLMILGTQWYILFNVIAGASAFPNDLKEAAASLRIKGFAWWRKVILPGIAPYFVTGALTASGGSWNASIVAEVASWGHDKLEAHGLGAFIADATTRGDTPRVVLGVAVMSLFVVAFNRALWRPLFNYASRRLRLD
jgi:NitT/TauT family transport system permease protein